MEHSYRLLAVDDEPDILRTNRRYLEARGYQVDTAVCAADALKRLGRQGYDCILLDVLLPDMSSVKLSVPLPAPQSCSSAVWMTRRIR